MMTRVSLFLAFLLSVVLALAALSVLSALLSDLASAQQEQRPATADPALHLRRLTRPGSTVSRAEPSPGLRCTGVSDFHAGRICDMRAMAAYWR